jgi:hypothetical protein
MDKQASKIGCRFFFARCTLEKLLVSNQTVRQEASLPGFFKSLREEAVSLNWRESLGTCVEGMT